MYIVENQEIPLNLVEETSHVMQSHSGEPQNRNNPAVSAVQGPGSRGGLTFLTGSPHIVSKAGN